MNRTAWCAHKWVPTIGDHFLFTFGLFAAMTLTAIANAQSDASESIQRDIAASTTERWSLHFQSTVGAQAHPRFTAKYSGQNSMNADAESATAFVSTLFADAALWPGAEIIFNPELSGGKGLSRTLGVAAFPSGLVYRVGDPAPVIYLARLELRQTIGLGGGRVEVKAQANELAGTRDRNALRLSVGRMAVSDVFDGNRFAHDPLEHFFNWALFASGAWDYPADTRGYTWAATADLAVDWWSLRAGLALEPKYANLTPMEWRINKSRGLMAEYEARYQVGERFGAARFLVFLNDARMGSYQQILDDPARYDNNVAATRAFGRTKYGFAISAEQELTPTLGAFVRVSMNDGRNETWAFAEIDRSVALGVVQNGALWHRDEDEIGAAFVVDGLSSLHRRYLEGGGYGFMLGDGRLNYGLEVVGDLYYRCQLNEFINLSALYQPVVNPGYNHDRGPIHVFSGRLHVAL